MRVLGAVCSLKSRHLYQVLLERLTPSDTLAWHLIQTSTTSTSWQCSRFRSSTHAGERPLPIPGKVRSSNPVWVQMFGGFTDDFHDTHFALRPKVLGAPAFTTPKPGALHLNPPTLRTSPKNLSCSSNPARTIMFTADRPLYHSTLGSRVITKDRKDIRASIHARSWSQLLVLGACGDRVLDGPASGGGRLQVCELARLYSAQRAGSAAASALRCMACIEVMHAGERPLYQYQERTLINTRRNPFIDTREETCFSTGVPCS